MIQASNRYMQALHSVLPFNNDLICCDFHKEKSEKIIQHVLKLHTESRAPLFMTTLKKNLHKKSRSNIDADLSKNGNSWHLWLESNSGLQYWLAHVLPWTATIHWLVYSSVWPFNVPFFHKKFPTFFHTIPERHVCLKKNFFLFLTLQHNQPEGLKMASWTHLNFCLLLYWIISII